MRNKARLICSICLLSISLSFYSVRCDALEITFDLLGVSSASRELSEAADRTMRQLSELEGKANYDVKERLEQLRGIVQQAIAGGQATIDKAVAAMNQLENQVNKDAIDLLYRTRCLAEIALMDQAQRSFAMFISNLIRANPGVKILGINVVNISVEPVTITDPDIAYISTKSAVLEKLKDIKEDTPAYSILSAYQNLERGAISARCIYLGQGLDVRWVKEVNELERLSAPWITVVEPSM
jgi:hypothetical protein